jgi:hypothetical protein
MLIAGRPQWIVKWRISGHSMLTNLSLDTQASVPCISAGFSTESSKTASSIRIKARLVTRGSHQRAGVDYGESFSPIMRLKSLRTLLALAALRDFDIMQFDITSAYLHGTLREDVWMEQPDGYVEPGREDWVWKLRKGLYGLVQAGRTWNDELNSYILAHDSLHLPFFDKFKYDFRSATSCFLHVNKIYKSFYQHNYM